MEELLRDLGELVGDQLGRIDEEGGEHGVEHHAFQVDAVAAQADPQPLGVVRDLGPALVFQEGLERGAGAVVEDRARWLVRRAAGLALGVSSLAARGAVAFPREAPRTRGPCLSPASPS